MLAQGGFVKANTPQLAMIGDNRHYGEVVAPENKLREMVDTAVRAASGSGITGRYYRPGCTPNHFRIVGDGILR